MKQYATKCIRVKDARWHFLYVATPDFVPSAAILGTVCCSCLLKIQGMHLLVKGRTEEKEMATPSLKVYVHF